MGVTWELSGHDAWRALQRTGATDKQTASWGLRWVQRVSSRLNEEEWTSLRQEIGALATHEGNSPPADVGSPGGNFPTGQLLSFLNGE